MSKAKVLLLAFSVSSFLSVALGAFGAHALKKSLSDEFLKIFETGNKYQFYHSLGGLLIILLYKTIRNPFFLRAGYFFLLGILVFSGSLYVLALTGIRKFGMITPIGGVSFLIGWIIVIYASAKEKI